MDRLVSYIIHTLIQVNEDARWYLEQGYIGGNKSKAIRQRVERLSTELRPHLEVLVRYWWMALGFHGTTLPPPLPNRDYLIKCVNRK